MLITKLLMAGRTGPPRGPHEARGPRVWGAWFTPNEILCFNNFAKNGWFLYKLSDYSQNGITAKWNWEDLYKLRALSNRTQARRSNISQSISYAWAEMKRRPTDDDDDLRLSFEQQKTDGQTDGRTDGRCGYLYYFPTTISNKEWKQMTTTNSQGTFNKWLHTNTHIHTKHIHKQT